MPIYSFKCPICKHKDDFYKSTPGDYKQICPKCDSQMKLDYKESLKTTPPQFGNYFDRMRKD